jgi:hypothetical protein
VKEKSEGDIFLLAMKVDNCGNCNENSNKDLRYITI